MSQVKIGEIFMDNPRIKVWPTLTRIYHQYIVKFVQNICTIWMKRNEVKETVLFSALQVSLAARSSFMSYYRMARYIIVCLSQRFSKNIFLEIKCPICARTSYSCGTVLAIILVSMCLIFWLV